MGVANRETVSRHKKVWLSTKKKKNFIREHKPSADELLLRINSIVFKNSAHRELLNRGPTVSAQHSSPTYLPFKKVFEMERNLGVQILKRAYQAADACGGGVFCVGRDVDVQGVHVLELDKACGEDSLVDVACRHPVEVCLLHGGHVFAVLEGEAGVVGEELYRVGLASCGWVESKCGVGSS